MAVGAINQNTSAAKIKAIIRVIIIVLVNTVPENEMFCESWLCPFVPHCNAACPCLSGNTVQAVHACELSCFCFASVFSLFEKVGGLEGVGFFSLEGVTLSNSMAVGVLTDCAVRMCLVERKKKDGSGGDLSVISLF